MVKVPGSELKAGTSLHLMSGLGKGFDADSAEEVIITAKDKVFDSVAAGLT